MTTPIYSGSVLKTIHDERIAELQAANRRPATGEAPRAPRLLELLRWVIRTR